MIQLFDIADVNRAASAINPDKLLWLNHHYIKTGDVQRLAELVSDQLKMALIPVDQGPALVDLVEVQKERIKTLTEIVEHSRYFYTDFDEFDEAAAKKHLRPVVLEPMTRLRALLGGISDWHKAALQQAVEQAASEFDLKLGKIAQPLRVAVTGGGVSPSIEDTLSLLGRQRCLQRLDRALDYIKQRADA